MQKLIQRIFKKFLMAIPILTIMLAASAYGSSTTLSNSPSTSTPPRIMYYNYHNILKVSDQPLFMAGGEINQSVLDALMVILNDPVLDPMLRSEKEYWPSGLPFDYLRYASYIAFTAEDFSNFVIPADERLNNSHSGAIIIQLFETIPDSYGIENGHLTEFTSEWWQLVYRAIDDQHDVLTLWMINPYRSSAFNGTASFSIEVSEGINHGWIPWIASSIVLNSPNTILTDYQIMQGIDTGIEPIPTVNFTREANYSQSIVRANLLRDLGTLLEAFDVSGYIVQPRDIPGNWQSSQFQTGTNIFRQFYATGQFRPDQSNDTHNLGSENPSDGLGASGRWANIHSFNINNGKDGLSIGAVNGSFSYSTAWPTYYDLLWLPSEFEIRVMGHNKDFANIQSFIRYINDITTDLVFARHGNRLIHRSHNGRTGLWRLNGFDRGFYPYALGSPLYFNNYTSWTRSAVTNALSNGNVVSAAGNRYGIDVSNVSGVRPALHLSLTRLLESDGQ